MKNTLVLALYHIRFNKIKTSIMVFSVAVAVFLPLAVNLLVDDYQRNITTRAQSTPLVAGAPGSRLDLVMHALYFRGNPAQDLTFSDVDKISKSDLAMAIPIIQKHTARGFPVVGTSLEYFDFRGLKLVHGSRLARIGDCVLGASVAKKLDLMPGDKLMSDPDNVFNLAGAYPLNMTVKGILAPAGTADDDAVFANFKTAWIVLGLMHGHQDVVKAGASPLPSSTVLPYQEITTGNLTRFHPHGDPATFPVSAIIVIPHDEKSAAILRGRYADPKTTVQILVPTQIMSEMIEIVFSIKKFFDAQAFMVGLAMVLLLALVVLLSLRLRRGEMETMFNLGCARGVIFALQATEIVLVLVAGAMIATGLAYLVLLQLRA